MDLREDFKDGNGPRERRGCLIETRGRRSNWRSEESHDTGDVRGHSLFEEALLAFEAQDRNIEWWWTVQQLLRMQSSATVPSIVRGKKPLLRLHRIFFFFFWESRQNWVLPLWLRKWIMQLQWEKPGFYHWVEKISWRKAWQPTPVFFYFFFHSSVLAWRIPWIEEPGGLHTIGLPRTGHDWVTKHRQNWIQQGTRTVLSTSGVRGICSLPSLSTADKTSVLPSHTSSPFSSQ